jgi:hypothetical protein
LYAKSIDLHAIIIVEKDAGKTRWAWTVLLAVYEQKTFRAATPPDAPIRTLAAIARPHKHADR